MLFKEVNRIIAGVLFKKMNRRLAVFCMFEKVNLTRFEAGTIIAHEENTG